MTGMRDWWRRALTRNPAAAVPVRVVGRRGARRRPRAVFVLDIEGQRLVGRHRAPDDLPALGTLPQADEERAS